MKFLTTFFSSSSSRSINKGLELHWFFVQLPIIASIMLEAHTHFLSNHLTGASTYLLTLGELFFVSIPLLLTHHAAYRVKGRMAVWIWFLGFVAYPLFRTLMFSPSYDNEGFPLLSIEGWAYPVIASSVWFLIINVKHPQKNHSVSLLSKLFSINAMLIISLIVWAAFIAGIFTYVDDPLRNQPLELVIDFVRIRDEFSTFCSYFWQFLLIAGLMFCTYLINRYLLIQRVLAKQGVILFILSGIITILFITPLFGSVVILLPVNIENYTLLPSTNYNIFAPDNYRFTFILLAISTPIILAFERQQQGIQLAQIAEQQTKTELKMLQQQINPHFLFNTLNNLYALALIKSDDCPEMVMKLSNLLRFTVYEGQNESVKLEQEVNYLKNYIELQQIRWGKQCDLALQWPDNADDWLISPMLLIILLENAFKYGVEPATTQTKVIFEVTISHGVLHLLCINPINKRCLSRHSGLGLINLQKRLELVYPSQHQLLSFEDQGYWKAELTLELKKC